MILKLDHVELYYEEFGTGTNYLLHAQQFANSHLYYTKDLAEKGFHVFNIRIRGYSPSSLADQDYGTSWYDVWAKDILDFADAMGIESFFYTGFSHGAGIGWHLCMAAPERIRGFFSLAGGPHRKDGKKTSSARMSTIEACETPEKWAAYAEEKTYQTGRVFKTLFDDPQVGADAKAAWEQNRSFWLNLKKESALINPQKPFPLAATEEALIEELRKIHVPALLIGGVWDTVSPPDTLTRTNAAVAGSKLIIYSGEYTLHADIAHAYRKEIVQDIMVFCQQKGLI